MRRPSGAPDLVVGTQEVEQRGNFFLNLDHQVGLVKFDAQAVAFTSDLRQAMGAFEVADA